MKFRAAILIEQNKPLVVDTVEPQRLQPGQVLVKVVVSGICGAQIGEITGAKGPDRFLPHLMGHEGGGVVIDTGPGVRTVKEGDHVVMHWRKGAGIDALPPVYRWRRSGVVGEAGAGPVATFAEYAVVSENRLTAVDKELPFEIAALMGCAVTTALGLINNEARVKIGESVAVFGAGGVGLVAIQGADLVGAHPIVAIDVSGHKLEMARANGATYADRPDFLASGNLRKRLGNFDVVIECTGVPEMIAAGWDLIKPETGRLVLVGQPHCDCDLTLPGFRSHYCGKTVMDSQGGLTNPAADIPRYVELYLVGKLCLDDLITHTFPLERVNEAVETVKSGEAGRCILTMD